MAVNVCPADDVQAPIEQVWELLMNPTGYGEFWDLTIERVAPSGPATIGLKGTPLPTQQAARLAASWRVPSPMHISEGSSTGT